MWGRGGRVQPKRKQMGLDWVANSTGRQKTRLNSEMTWACVILFKILSAQHAHLSSILSTQTVRVESCLLKVAPGPLQHGTRDPNTYTHPRAQK